MLEDKDKVVLLQAHKQIQIFGHLNFKEAYAGVTTTSTSNNPSLDLDDDDNDNSNIHGESTQPMGPTIMTMHSEMNT